MRTLAISFCFTITLVFILIGCSDQTVTTKEPETLRCPDASVLHEGDATFYTFASGAGACMFDSTPNDLMVAAMNTKDFDNSNLCGAYVKVNGPNGTSVNVRIVDLCPDCSEGHIDLSPSAFAQLADTSKGRIRVTWQVIEYNVAGPIQYHFKDGSNQWWTAVQIRNHRYPIYSVEYLAGDNSYKKINRTNYNYFVQSNPGMGPGPYTFRVTDIYGHVVVDSAITHVENGTVSGKSQFPSCN